MKLPAHKSLSDPKVFESLFREYFKAMSWYAYRFVRDQDAAKEITHIVFVNLWERRDEISPEKSLRSYLFTAVHNRCLNYLRDHAKFLRHDVSEMPGLEMPAENEASGDEPELEYLLLSAIDDLPPRCAEIFKLNRLERKKYKEIAESMNISVKTVEAQMSKALRILRQKFKDYINLLITWMLYLFF